MGIATIPPLRGGATGRETGASLYTAATSGPVALTDENRFGLLGKAAVLSGAHTSDKPAAHSPESPRRAAKKIGDSTGQFKEQSDLGV